MEFSSERCIPGRKGLEVLELEHRARYAAAAGRAAGCRVLDLGSGAGYGAAMLAESASFVFGLDISGEAVAFASENYGRGNIRFFQADLAADDLLDRVRSVHPEPFDLITCFEVIEHLAQPQKLLRAARELLAPGGALFISTPNIDYPFDVDAVNPHHVTEYTLDGFRNCLGAVFPHVTVTGQKVHLLSTIGAAPEDPVPFAHWRGGPADEAKYYVAVCGESESAAAAPGLALLTGDAHLKVVHARLNQARSELEAKTQRLKSLEAHLADLKRVKGEDVLAQLRRLQDENAALRRSIKAPQQQTAEELRLAERERQDLRRQLDKVREDARRQMDKDREDARRQMEALSLETLQRQNQLRRELEGFKNHPAVRRLLRLRTPGLKLLGLLGLGTGAGKKKIKEIIPGATPQPPAPKLPVPEWVDDARSYGEILQDRRVAADGESMPLLSENTLARLRADLLARPQDTLVSVIMPAYNRASTLGRAVESVLAQSHKNWELLVVDDGSDDDTPAVAAGYAAKCGNIRVISIPHGGVSAARDAGLREARGDMVAYLDSDNRWLPDYLLFTVQALLESGAKTACSALRIIDEDNNGAVSHRARRFDLDALLKNNFIDINIYAHRRELFGELGGFDPELRRWVDWDIILRQTARHYPAEIPAVLCEYFRKEKLNQITLDEPQAYKFKVLNKHLINWPRLERELSGRVPGRVSVIIPVLNLPDLTRDCVNAIHAHSAETDYEIVLVDNGCAPDTAAVLADLARHPRVRLVSNYENYMFSLGNNLGMAESTGEYLVLLNNDTRVSPGWLAPLIAPLRDDPDTGMTGPKLLYPDGTVQAAGLVFSDRSVIPYHIYRGMPGDAPCVNKRRNFQALTAACAAMRAADYIALGGLDPVYVNGCEDLDLCFKVARRLKKALLYVPESVVVHLESKTPGRAKGIRHNRMTFLEAWGGAVRPDDQMFYAEDGFRVLGYAKHGNDPDGPTATYLPEIEPVGGGEAWTAPAPAPAPENTLNIGLVCIWHVRGVTLLARQLAGALEADAGFRVHILARWESEKFFEGPPVDHPRVVNGGDDPAPADCVEWARNNRLDAVLFVEAHPRDWKRVDALKAAGFRVFGYEHLDVLRIEMLDRYNRFDGMLHSSFEAWRVFRRVHPQIPALVLPWGVPESLLPPPRGPRPAGQPLRFVHVAGWGGLNNRKNTDGLIRAWHRANPENALLDLHTQAPADQYGPDCARILRDAKNITLHEGTVENILQAYAGADMLLWPSKREGLGLPIVEALACGLPVLVSDGYMMKQWLLPGEHGVVCPATAREGMMYLPEMRVDEAALAAMIAGLAANPDRVDALAERVRNDRALWLWSWQEAALREQLRAWLEDGVPPDPGLGYIPAALLEFEEARRKAFGES